MNIETESRCKAAVNAAGGRYLGEVDGVVRFLDPDTDDELRLRVEMTTGLSVAIALFNNRQFRQQHQSKMGRQ